MSKTLLLALGAGGAAAAAVVASASTLGTVDATDLGAGTSVVASCDSDGIDVSYTTEYGAGGAYDVATVTLDDVAATCGGQDVEVTLAGPSNAVVLDTLSGTVDDTSLSFTVSGVPAADLTRVAVVISG